MGTKRAPVAYNRALIIGDAADNGWDRRQLAQQVRTVAHERGEVAPAISTIYRFLDAADPIQTPRIALLIALALGHPSAARYRQGRDRRTGERRSPVTESSLVLA